MPFLFLRSQTQGMGTELVRALEVVRVTKQVLCLDPLSALVFPFLAVGYGAYWLVVAIGASRTLPEASRTVSLYRVDRAPRGALAFSDAVVLD